NAKASAKAAGMISPINVKMRRTNAWPRLPLRCPVLVGRSRGKVQRVDKPCSRAAEGVRCNRVFDCALEQRTPGRGDHHARAVTDSSDRVLFGAGGRPDAGIEYRSELPRRRQCR